ncbi:TetR/AcrR family transcriptional regulator [Pendulispora rubella]|uniref:TetR/AcrR family transcriptional regulator n=1 Tax=Pendulispora rubella TaxID=2741070 RepID=A0ABZ2L165_9BACT
MTRRRLDPEERRGELIAAALRLLAKRPARVISPEDVTHEAKVSRALFYRYFPSVEELELAALRNVAERLPFLPPPDAPLGEQVAQAIHAFFDFAAMLKGPTIALLGPAPRASPKAHELIEGGRDRIVAIMCARAGIAKPSLLVELTLRSWTGVVDRAVVGWLEKGDEAIPRAELEAWLLEELTLMLEPVIRREHLTIAWSTPPPRRRPARSAH